MKILIVGGLQLQQMIKTMYNGFIRDGHCVEWLPYFLEEEDPAALLHMCRMFKPDVLYAHCAERWEQPEVLQDISAIKFYWDFDMPQELMFRGKNELVNIIQYFDVASSTCDSEPVKNLFAAAKVPLHWMPPLWDVTQEVRPQDVPKDWLTIVGSGRRADRTPLLEAVQDSYPLVKVYGPKWPKRFDGKVIHWQRQFDIYASSHLNIGSFRKRPLTVSRALNFRSVLVPGSGGVLLNEWHEGIEECFEPETEMLYWNTPDDLLNLIEKWKNEDVSHIRHNARRRVMKEYTTDLWIPRIINWVKEVM